MQLSLITLLPVLLIPGPPPVLDPPPATRPAELPPVDEPTVERVATGFGFTEGPAIGPEQTVFFTDLRNRRIHRYDPASGETVITNEASGGANGLAFDAEGSFYAAEGVARQVTRTDPDGSVTVLALHFGGAALNSPNDLAVDRFGGVYFTDPRYGKRDDMEQEEEAVYYVRPRRGVERLITDLDRPNGIALAPDESTLYVADNAAKKLYAYDVPGPGALHGKRVFAEMDHDAQGGPDGLAVDAGGRVYAAGQGALWVWSADGEPLARVPIPEEPTNVAVARPDGTLLYVTARKSLYRVRLPAWGDDTAAESTEGPPADAEPGEDADETDLFGD